MLARASRLTRLVPILVALAFAVIPAASANAAVVFSPDTTLTFPSTSTVGMQTLDQTLTLSNTSTTTGVNLTAPQIVGANSNSFALGPSTCPPTLGPSGTCSVNVRFSPSNPGALNALVSVGNNGGAGPATRPLAGTGVAASLSLSPNSVDFGLVSLEERDVMSQVTIQNTGTTSAQVNQINISGPDSPAFQAQSSDCQAQVLAPSQTCTVSVRFEPNEGRAYDATLLVSMAGNPASQAALTGVGGVGNLSLSPDPLDFGNVPVGDSATATIIARSTGNAAFQSILTVLTGGDIGDLRVTRDTCSLRLLLPDQTCATTVRFAPTAVGPAEAVLLVIGDGDADPHLAMVRGVGTAPTPPAPSAEKARVAFARKSPVARFAGGRVRLGPARCKGAPRCKVAVSTRFTIKPGHGRPARLVRGPGGNWTLGSGRLVSVALPKDVRGTVSRVVVTLTTSAPDHPGSVQRRALVLLPGTAKS